MSPFIVAVVFVTLQISSLCDAKPRGKIELLPDGCKGKTYCFTKHNHYPKETIQALLKDIDELIVETDGASHSSVNATDYKENLPCDCETNIFMQPIYEIIDEEDNLRFVAQSAKFRQVIRIEECLKPGRLTGDSYNFPGIVLEQVNLHCVETRIPYQFIVLSLDGQSMESVSVKGGVPVSCNSRLEEDASDY